MSDHGESTDLPRSESTLWDSMLSFFGSTTEESFGEQNRGNEAENTRDSANDIDSDDSTETRVRKRDAAEIRKKQSLKRSASGSAEGSGNALGRRKSVWDSMREIVTGEEEPVDGENGADGEESDEADKEPPYTNKVLVTGAEGFIAGWVIKLLIEKGFSVIGTVRTLRNKAKHEHLFKLVPEIQDENPDVLELMEADLSRPMSFDRAIDKVEYVIHVAGPFKLGVRDAKVGLINPSVQGTLNVLRGCVKCQHIKRVVVTSCASAIVGKPDDRKEYTEDDWNTESTLDTYPFHVAKTEAEKAANDFVKKLPSGNKLSLITLCPTFVVGPLLNGENGTLNTSLRILQDVMKGLVPFVPKMGLPLVDVRDVANAHVLAVLNPSATGRYIVHCDTMWFRDVVSVFKSNYKRGNFPAKEKSKFFVRRNEVFMRNMPFQFIRPWLGRYPRFVNRKIRKDLGIEFRPVEKALVDMCESFEKWNL